MSGKCDLEREHRFLVHAAGSDGAFVSHVQQRLAAGEDRFGNSWAWIGLRRHLSELLEEAADLGAWAALAEQTLAYEQLTHVQRDQIHSVLRAAACRGARAHELLSRALQSIEARS